MCIRDFLHYHIARWSYWELIPLLFLLDLWDKIICWSGSHPYLNNNIMEQKTCIILCFLIKIKNLTCGGWDRPHGIVWEVEWPSHSRPRKPPNPCPTRTRGPVALWVRPGSTVLWTWDKRGSFFNPRAEIRPRGGSNPGPLGSASSGATTTVAGLWHDDTWESLNFEAACQIG